MLCYPFHAYILEDASGNGTARVTALEEIIL